MPQNRARRGLTWPADLSLTGESLDEEDAPSKPARASRAVVFDPLQPRTWLEADAQVWLKERLRLGAWVAWHVRKQGHRSEWGREHAGIIEAVPTSAGWGVLDWVCVPTMRETGVLWIELKAEKRGKVTEDQANHALILAKAGQEVAVLRPRHFMAAHGAPDPVFLRLVEHRVTQDWYATLVQPSMSIGEILKL